jgi:hypothetical protein
MIKKFVYIKKYIIGKNLGPHAHDIIMKRLQNIWRILVLLHHVVLREAHHCTGHSSSKWFKLSGTPTVCLCR